MQNKRMKFLLLKIVLFWGVLSSCGLLTATAQEDKAIVFPEKVKEGWLENGLHYVIIPNDQPKRQVEFRLVMRVGARMEPANEPGTAHFLEHMAFEDTKHFPKQGLVKYLEHIGMKYGRDINAYTGYDKTVYMFTAPLYEHKKEVLQQSLKILRDWLHGIEFHKEAVERERKIILEELGAYTQDDPFYDLKIGNNVYADHIPLGTAEDIKQVTIEKLKHYYSTWYQPQMATVLVVGDISPKKVEREIQRLFSIIPRKEVPDHRRHLTYAKGVQVKMKADSLATCHQMEVIIPHTAIVQKTVGDAVAKKRTQLLLRLISKRWEGQDIDCNIYDTWYLSDQSHVAITTQGNTYQAMKENMAQALSTLQTMALQGFTVEELNEQKEKLAVSCMLESTDGLSVEWCDELLDYLIYGDKLLYEQAQVDALKEAIVQTTSTQLQAILLNWIQQGKEQTTLVPCTMAAPKVDALVRKELFSIWSWKPKKPVKSFVWKPTVKEEKKKMLELPFLTQEKQLESGVITEKCYHADLDVFEWKLKNGIRLIMRSVDSNQEVSTFTMSAFIPGGSADIPRDRFHQLEECAGYMEMGGIEGLAREKYNTFLMEHELSLTSALDNHWHKLSGRAPIAEATSFFNLLNHRIYHPEVPRADFQEVRQTSLDEFGQENGLQKMMRCNPVRQLDLKKRILMGDALQTPKLMRHDFEAQNIDSIATFYTQIFSATEGATYIFVGNFEPKKFGEIAAAHLGAMPRASWVQKSQWPSALPNQSADYRFENEKKDQVHFHALLSGHYEGGVKGELKLKLIRELIQRRIIEELRMKRTLTYSPYCILNYRGVPDRRFCLDIEATVNRANYGVAKELVVDLLKELSSTPVPKDELEMIQRSFLIRKDAALHHRAEKAWKDLLQRLVEHGESIADYNQYTVLIQSITPEEIQQTIQQICNLETVQWLYQEHKSSTYQSDKPAYVIYNAEGEKVTYQTMLRSLVQEQVVLFGEQHDDAMSHWLEKLVLRDLYRVHQKELIVGAEMWEADNQSLLNAFVKGDLSMDEYLKRSKRVWHNMKRDYMPLLQFCIEKKLHFVATNIPRPLANQVAKKGAKALVALPDSVQRFLPPLPFHFNLKAKSYQLMRKMITEASSGGMQQMMRFDPTRLLQAQAVKDATMAWHIHQALKRPLQRFFHFHGAMHSVAHSGIAYYLHYFNPKIKVGTIAVQKMEDPFLFEPKEAVADFTIVVPESMVTTYGE